MFMAIFDGVVGGFGGLSLSNNSALALAWALGGAVVLGGSAAVYQYFVWTNWPRAVAHELVLLAGFGFGGGLLEATGATRRLGYTGSAVLSFSIGAVASFGFLLATHEAEMTAGDVLTIGAGAVDGLLLAFILSNLVMSLGGDGLPGAGYFMAPAIGEALGGVIALLARPRGRTAAMAGFIPIGVTLAYALVAGMFTLGSYRGPGPLYWGSVGAVWAVSTAGFAALGALTGKKAPTADEEGQAASGVEWMPTLTLVPDSSGRRGPSPAVAVLGRF
jgi:hypothetical protein